MEFEYDPGKDASNQTKHGLSLAAGEALFADPDRLILPSIRKIDGEERFKVVARWQDKLHTAVFVWRDGRIRLISVRRSNDGEERAYHSG
jgi:uncharacterized DUF497 family protein